MYWRRKIANLNPGEVVTELEAFDVNTGTQEDFAGRLWRAIMRTKMPGHDVP